MIIEKHFQGFYLITDRLNNGDLFKRRYWLHTKRESIRLFKLEFKAENNK